MMSRDDIQHALKHCERDLVERFGVKKLTLFGSYARDEAEEHSDVDVMVEFEGSATLERYAGTHAHLESVLGKRVDLVTSDSVHPALRATIDDPFQPRKWKFLVERMLESCKRAKCYTRNLTLERFCADDLTYQATLMNLGNLARAANAISEEHRSAYVEIDWEKTIAIERLVSYRLGGLDDHRIWEVIQNYLPELEQHLEAILAKETAGEW